MADNSKYQWNVSGKVIKHGGSVGGITIDTSILDKMTAEMKPKARVIVNKYGVAIAGDAAKRSPKDTHALENSILANSQMIADMTYRVQDAVEYGIFQELGTSKMAAQPFIVPAVEAWREKFLKAFGELFK